MLLNAEELNLELESESAQFSELDDFTWYKYEGRNKKTVENHRRKEEIRKGDKFGLKQIRGGNFYLILPDLYQYNFPITSRVANNMVKNSKRSRKPKIEDKKAGGNKRIPKTSSRKEDTGADRFKPLKRVPAEKNGIEFKNYQFRKLKTNIFKHNKTNKIMYVIEKNETFGVRFINNTAGGVVVFGDGRYFRIPAEKYDDLVEKSDILPLSKWPRREKLTKKQMETFEQRRKDQDDERRRREKAERKEIADAKRAAKKQAELKQQLEQHKKLEEQKKRIRKVTEKIPESIRNEVIEDRVGGKVKVIDNLDNAMTNIPQDDSVIDGLDNLADENVNLDLEDLDIEDDYKEDPQIDENEIDIVDADQDAVDSALDKEIEEAEQEVEDNNFDDPDEDADTDDEDEEDLEDDLDDDLEDEDEDDLDDDDDDLDDDDDDLDDDDDIEEEVEDFEDDEEIAEREERERKDAKEAKRKKKKEKREAEKAAKTNEDLDDDEDTEETDEDEDDLVDDLDEDEDEDNEDEDLDDDLEDDDDLDDEEEPDEEFLEEDVAEQEAEEAIDSVDTDEDYDDIDSELSEEGEDDETEDEDDTESGEDSDDDSDQEEQKKEFEPGDVVVFNEDTTEKREWVILDIKEMPNNDSIRLYKMYDINADDKTFRHVRVVDGNKNTVEKQAKFVRTLKPKEFAEFYNKHETYKRVKDPITS